MVIESRAQRFAGVWTAIGASERRKNGEVVCVASACT